MTRRSALTLACVFLPAALWAQTAARTSATPAAAAQRRNPNIEYRLKTLDGRLKLADPQKAKIKALLQHEQEQLSELHRVHRAGAAEQRERRDQFLQIRKETNEKIRALLTEEQQQTFDKMQQERQEKMERYRRSGRHGAPESTPNTQNAPDMKQQTEGPKQQ